jgi:hypothetical protein
MFIDIKDKEMNTYKDLCVTIEKSSKIGIKSILVEEKMSETGQSFKDVLDMCFLDHIKERYENKCTTEGFVLGNSVEIQKRSNVEFPIESLKIHYTSYIHWKMKVCCPHVDSLIECKVLSKNKIGILGSLKEKSPLVVLVPYDLAENDEEREMIENASKDDMLPVKIIGKKYEQNDKQIVVLAKCNAM